MSSSSMKNLRRAVQVVLVMVLLLMGASLYDLSGLPKPWGKPGKLAEERYYSNKALFLARMIKYQMEAHGTAYVTPDEVRSILEKEELHIIGDGASIDSMQFRVVKNPSELGSIIFRTLQQDAYGMVWAVTNTGEVIKIKEGVPTAE